MSKRISLERTLRVSQLAACGAIIGLYAVKSVDLVGFADIPLRVETLAAAIGAAIVLVLAILRKS